MLRRRTLVALSIAAAAVMAPASASAAPTFAGQWGSAGTGPGQFSVPQGVAADRAGNVYVADGNGNRIEKFDSAGNFLQAFGGSGNGPVQFNGPGHLALDPQGNLLVADEGNYRIQKISPTGTFLLQYGRFGQNPGQFRGNPRGVAADGAGNVYVVDTGQGGKIDKFAADGTFLTSWGQQGSGPGQWGSPRGLEVDPAGNVYVGDTDNDRIDVFTGDGAFVRSFGPPAQLGFPGELAIDSHGNVFVADNAPGGVVQFDPNGAFVARVSTATSSSDSFRPNGVAVGAGDDVFTDDVGKSRVLRFSQAPPPPQLGKTATVQKVTGNVLLRPPGSRTFVDLTKNGGASIPLGSMLDTTHGTVSLSLSKGGGGGTQSGSFSQGRFVITQSKAPRARGLTQLSLAGGGSWKRCKGKRRAAHASARRPHRSLFASVHGRFRTRGRHSTATVRGTKWLTKDTCAGTLTRVMQGTVVVRDFAKHRNVTVRKGHSYLARARR